MARIRGSLAGCSLTSAFARLARVAACATLACALASGASAATCGDGTVESPEQCDDGNVVSGDGCSSSCLVECPSLDGDWKAENTAPGAGEDTWHIDEDGSGNLAIETESGGTLAGTRTPPGVLSTIALESVGEPFTYTFSGEMYTCNVIYLDIELLPYVITLTRIVPPPSCPDALPLASTTVKLANLTAAPGEQGLVATGRIIPPPGFSFDPASTGVQVLLEDLGAGGAPLFDATYATRTIPATADDTCPARSEGWRRTTYRNAMKPLDAESCRVGTADVLTLRLADLRPRRNELSFTLRVRGASIAPPVGRVRLTVAFGTTADDLAAAQCGVERPQPPLDCAASTNGKQLTCR